MGIIGSIVLFEQRVDRKMNREFDVRQGALRLYKSESVSSHTNLKRCPAVSLIGPYIK